MCIWSDFWPHWRKAMLLLFTDFYPNYLPFINHNLFILILAPISFYFMIQTLLYDYRNTFTGRTSLGNKIVDHSDVVGAALLQLHLHSPLNTWPRHLRDETRDIFVLQFSASYMRGFFTILTFKHLHLTQVHIPIWCGLIYVDIPPNDNRGSAPDCHGHTTWWNSWILAALGEIWSVELVGGNWPLLVTDINYEVLSSF